VPDLDDTLRGGSSLSALISKAQRVAPPPVVPAAPNEPPPAELGTHDPDPDVMACLDTYINKAKQIEVRDSRQNVYTILTKDRRLKGKLWLDTFQNTLMNDKEEYRDTDDTRNGIWLDRVYKLRIGPKAISEVVKLVAEENAHNPLIDWLLSLSWDGVERVGEWLTTGLGAKDTVFHKEVARRWFIQAVARAMEPGCKADCVLILVGPQGARKSTAFRVLAGDKYFCDTPMDIGTPNAYTQIQRAWIYEVAELDSIRAAKHSATKAFLSAQEDTYRPAYGRHSVTVKRHCVFCGTTNEDTFITDSTGSRRFWPIRVGNVDLEWLRRNRLQLWAEAVHAYQAKERWWLTTDHEVALDAKSEDFRQQDPWQPVLAKWASTRQSFTTADAMRLGLELDPRAMTRRFEVRTGEVLRSLGYIRTRSKVEGRTTYTWSKFGSIADLENLVDG